MSDPTTPVVPSSGVLRPLGVDAVRLSDGFWADLQERNRSRILPHCYEWLDRAGWLGNFRLAVAGPLAQDRRGREFSDSEVYKLAEALAWESARTGDAWADETLRDIGTAIAAAQEPGGYLNTRFGRRGQAPRYSDLEWGHEMYCLGHLIQAGVARLRGGVVDELTGAARRAADHVCTEFGPGGRSGYCGHPEIEMALVELYRATGEERYLVQAQRFVDARGSATLADIEFGRAYYQDDMRVRDRTAFTGHAVRALYLACGAVDVAVEVGDRALLDAIERQWETTVARRTYLTGGMGARQVGESFGDDFELPADGAYIETCAAVASVMLSWRLLLATGRSRYAELAERTLYNVIATAPGRDGRSFFYSNPLRQRMKGEPFDPRQPSPRATSGLRAPWFDVSCCPTNTARTLASIGAYLATTDPGGVQVHQYAAGEIRADLARGPVSLRVSTSYPWHGEVRVRVGQTVPGGWRLSLRVPAWAVGALVRTPEREHRAAAGVFVTDREWREGDEVVLSLPVAPRWTWPDPRIDAIRGCVAAQRGPLVYCAESVDAEDDLDAVAVVTSKAPQDAAPSGLGPHAVVLEAAGTWREITTDAWPYGDRRELDGRPATLTLVPYHLWASRGPATMRVWLPEEV
jgi:hypothetical protein